MKEQGTYSIDKLQELGLGGGGIAHQQDVDITTKSSSIRKDTWGTTKEQAAQGLLDIYTSTRKKR